MCGDSTNKDNLKKLKNGIAFDLLLTDPPYGIDASNMTLGTGKKQFHRGEDWDKGRPDLQSIMREADLQIIWGGNYFADQLPISNDWLCWHKKNDGLSFSEFELAWTNLKCNTRLLSHHWSGEQKLHPTMKPVAVITWCFEYAPKTKTVFDPFGGSGSTLIAAQETNRVAYLMELDPHYVDVICARYQKLSGVLPVLESSGKVHDFLNA
jgi:DNA modification methylase